jgi:hypothetical protein
MTIVIPKPGLMDKLLRRIGKKRGVAVQGETTDPSETQFYFATRKESLLSAILRPCRAALPVGMADIFTLQYDNRVEERKQGSFCKTFSLRSGAGEPYLGLDIR